MINRKDRLHYPYIPTVVVDDFFETPDMIRSFALQQEYFKGNRGYWPGIRSGFLKDLNYDLYELLQYKILKQLPKFKKIISLESTFQLINENYVRGWVHDDAPEVNFAGFIYLSPNPPAGSGTTFFEDTPRPTMMEQYAEVFADDVGRQPDEPPREEFTKYRNEQLSWFKETAEVENVYNRAVIFDPRTWHTANNFFGTTREDTRLTLVYFGRAE